MPSVNIRVEKVSDDQQKAGVPSQEKVGDKASKEKLAVASLFAHQAISTTKQIVNYAVSNIGNFTGDYIKQERVQESLSAVGDLATIGTAFATNWVAGVIATIGVATKKVFEVISENQTVKHAENNAEYLRKRSGNSLDNNSRTGD